MAIPLVGQPLVGQPRRITSTSGYYLDKMSKFEWLNPPTWGKGWVQRIGYGCTLPFRVVARAVGAVGVSFFGGGYGFFYHLGKAAFSEEDGWEHFTSAILDGGRCLTLGIPAAVGFALAPKVYNLDKYKIRPFCLEMGINVLLGAGLPVSLAALGSVALVCLGALFYSCVIQGQGCGGNCCQPTSPCAANVGEAAGTLAKGIVTPKRDSFQDKLSQNPN